MRSAPEIVEQAMKSSWPFNELYGEIECVKDEKLEGVVVKYVEPTGFSCKTYWPPEYENWTTTANHTWKKIRDKVKKHKEDWALFESECWLPE